MPLIQDFFGLETFLHQNSGPTIFLLGKEKLGLLLGDVLDCFVDGAPGLADLSFRFFQRGRKVARIHARDNLAGFDQIAFIARISAIAGGVFGIDVDFVSFEPAIAVINAGRQ